MAGNRKVLRMSGPLSLSAFLTQQILELIRVEKLKPKDRLPSVRALAQRFSVTPPTIREALGHLQANGIVEIRHGSGVYVCNGWEHLVLANPNHSEIEPDTVLHLLEARLFIEPHLAESTARRIDEAEIAELEDFLEDADRYLDGSDDEALHHANWNFHRAVARFSNKPILAQIIESLLQLYSYEQLALISFYDDRSRDHTEHMEVLAAVRDRDSELACELMRQHLQGVRSVVEAKLSLGIGADGWDRS